MHCNKIECPVFPLPRLKAMRGEKAAGASHLSHSVSAQKLPVLGSCANPFLVFFSSAEDNRNLGNKLVLRDAGSSLSKCNHMVNAKLPKQRF